MLKWCESNDGLRTQLRLDAPAKKVKMALPSPAAAEIAGEVTLAPAKGTRKPIEGGNTNGAAE